MKSIRVVMRTIGDESAGGVPPEVFENYLEENFFEQGYEVYNYHVEPFYQDSVFRGYRILVTLIKSE